jgi:4-hydroxybenzoate polyprenyltransferase
MSAIVLVVLVAFTVLVLGTVYLLNYFIDRRLDRLENSLRELRVDMARINQKLDDHVEHHPGPSTRLVRP